DLILWDPGTGKERQRLKGLAERAAGLAFSPDGKTLLAAGEGEEVVRWDVKTTKPLPKLADKYVDVSCLAVSSDGRRLAAGFNGRLCAVVWDAATGKRLGECGDEGNTTAAAFAPGGLLLATGASGGGVRLWEVVTGHQRRVLTGHVGTVQALA